MNKLYPVLTLLFCLIGFSGYVNSNSIELKKMNSKTVCDASALEKTQEMIRFILDDITKTYTQVGGGGITKINQIATNSYMVSISQEERIDEITYELSIDSACKISIVNKKITASSPWEK